MTTVSKIFKDRYLKRQFSQKKTCQIIIRKKLSFAQIPMALLSGISRKTYRQNLEIIDF